MEHLPEFIENVKNCKQINDFVDLKKCQKRPQARKPIFLGLESEKSENQIPFCESFEKYLKFAHGISVQNGCDAFPNELMRFRFDKIQKHCKIAVIN